MQNGGGNDHFIRANLINDGIWENGEKETGDRKTAGLEGYMPDGLVEFLYKNSSLLLLNKFPKSSW